MRRAEHVPKEQLLQSRDGTTPDLERENVQKVYDQIANQWDGTRYKAWPKVAEFIETYSKDSLIGDIGCGNGKNIFVINKSGGFGIGCDFSSSLVGICKQASMEVFVGDATGLPYRDSIFDAVLSIAVLHHISSRERRILLIRECMRVLRIGGKGLFYAWALEQRGGRSGHRFDTQDVLVPWHERGGEERVFQRYCHVYTEGELLGLFAELDWVEVELEYYDTGNWCIIARKIRES